MWPFSESGSIPFLPLNWLSQPLPPADSPSSSAPTPLCSVCRTTIQEGPKTTPRSQPGLLVPHHKTVNSFRESVAQECHLCTVLWHKIPLAGQNSLGRIRLDECVTLLYFLPGNGFNSITVCMKVSPSVGLWNMSWKILTGRLMDVAEAPTALFTLQPAQVWQPYNLHSPAGNSTGSEEAWALAMRWYTECITKHARCKGFQLKKKWFPSRLIDIGLSENCDPKLLTTKDTPPDGPYVTLSHCWGSANFLRLTGDSFSTFSNNISISELPKTFCDAIYVTRRLGFRYIWIDSLCIIQDSADDWAREALLMHLVYSNAMCNIAATGAIDSSKGLFHQRSAHALYPCEVDTYWNGLDKPVRYQIFDQAFWQTNISDAPLNQRAWVVQERFLAPRVLHFGAKQIMWECHELDAAEKYPAGVPPQLGTGFKMLQRTLDQARLSRQSGGEWDDTYALNDVWGMIVRVYSWSRLTKVDDKVLALAGIAKLFQRLLKDEYVAGLWKGHLASQLLWNVVRKKHGITKNSIRPSTYRAPSFSWMSVDGEIAPFPKTKEGILIDIVAVNIVTTTPDNMGPIKDGYLRLRGILKPLKVMQLSWWSGIGVGMIVNGVEIRDNDSAAGEWSTPLVYFDVDQDESAGDLYCMCFCSGIFPNGQHFLTGLILKPTDREAGQFRRLGVFKTMSRKLIDMLLVPIEGGETLPCESYDTSSSKNTICIV